MLRSVTAFLKRLSRPLSKKSRYSKPLQVVRLPPGLYIPPSKERASYYRKISAVNQARTTTSSSRPRIPDDFKVVPIYRGIDVQELRLPERSNLEPGRSEPDDS